MDRITLLKNGQVFMTDYAAPSVLTGRFVASIIDSSRDEIESAFADPSDIMVHNMEGLYADETYTGYRGIHEIRENGDRFVVILDKGEGNDGET